MGGPAGIRTRKARRSHDRSGGGHRRRVGRRSAAGAVDCLIERRHPRRGRPGGADRGRSARGLAAPIYTKTLGGDVELRPWRWDWSRSRSWPSSGRKRRSWRWYSLRRGLATSQATVVLSGEGHELERIGVHSTRADERRFGSTCNSPGRAFIGTRPIALPAHRRGHPDQ